MRTPRLGSIPHNAQALFTDAEFEVARLIYVNQQRAAQACRVRYIVCKTFKANGRYAGHAYFAGMRKGGDIPLFTIFREEALAFDDARAADSFAMAIDCNVEVK